MQVDTSNAEPTRAALVPFLAWTIDTIPPVSRTYDMRSQIRMLCDRIVDLATILPKVQPLARAGPVMRGPSQQRPRAGESERSASAIPPPPLLGRQSAHVIGLPCSYYDKPTSGERE